MRNSDSVTEPPPSRNKPNTAPASTSVVYTADSRPRPIPDNTTVAEPVSEVRATSLVGLESVPVKYPVSQRMIPASTIPPMTATVATTRGSESSEAMASGTSVSSAKEPGR